MTAQRTLLCRLPWTCSSMLSYASLPVPSASYGNSGYITSENVKDAEDIISCQGLWCSCKASAAS